MNRHPFSRPRLAREASEPIDLAPTVSLETRVESPGLGIVECDAPLAADNGFFKFAECFMQERGALYPIGLVRESALELLTHPLCLIEAPRLDQVQRPVREPFEQVQNGIKYHVGRVRPARKLDPPLLRRRRCGRATRRNHPTDRSVEAFLRQGSSGG